MNLIFSNFSFQFFHNFRDKMRKFELKELANQTLTVVVPKIEAPYVNNISHMVDEPGIVWEILLDMAKHLNLSFNVVSMEQEGWGKKNPWGPWNGALGMLAKGKADILAGGTIMNAERYSIVDFTVPIAFQESAVLVRVPDLNVSQILFSAFYWQLAFVPLLLFLVAFGIFFLVTKKVDNLADSAFCFFAVPVASLYSPYYFFSFYTFHVRAHPSHYFASLFILLTFLFAAFLLSVNFCVTSLSPSFGQNTMKAPFETINEIIKEVKIGEWTLVLDKKTPGRTKLLESVIDDPEFYNLFEEHKRIVFVDGLINGIHFVQNHSGKAVLIGPTFRLRQLATIMCDVRVLPKTVLPAAYMSLALRKGSPYRQFLDKRSKRIQKYLIFSYWDSGHILRWSRILSFDVMVRSRINQTKCATTRSNQLRIGIFGLAHLANFFFLLLFGWFFFSVFFAFELAIHSVPKKKRRK